jgi:DNA modification methylase
MNIQPYADNAKKHPEKQIQLIANSIQRFGWQQPIVVDKNGIIIVGHGRYTAWQKHPEGMDEPWVTDNEGNTISGKQGRELTAKEVKAYRLADNKLNESDWDLELAIEELKDIDDPALQELTGFDMDLLLEPEEADDAVPDTPKEPKSKLGDLYQLGPHRVLCGDSTKMEDVERLMDGKKANITFTDPPYLMAFKGNVHGDGSKSHNAKHGGLINDDLKEEDKEAFINGFLANIRLFTVGAYYICWYRLGLHHLFNGIAQNNLDYKALIIWDKGNHTLSNSDYMSRYEPIVYGWVEEHNFYGGRSCFDLWSVQRTAKNELHPTMKPVELVSKAITDSTQQNGVILDLFLGSGSTLIAAQKTGRICYGMELSEKYTDVIVQRYVDYVDNPTIILNNEDVTHLWQKTTK